MPSSSPRKTIKHVVLHCCPTGMEALNIGSFELAGGGGALHEKLSQALCRGKSWQHHSVCRLTHTRIPLNVLLDLIASEGYDIKAMGMCPYDATRDEGLTYTFAKEVALDD